MSNPNNPYQPGQNPSPYASPQSPYSTPPKNFGGPPGQSDIKGMLMGPGIGLLVIGVLGLLGMGGYFILTLIGLSMDPAAAGPDLNAPPEEKFGYYVGFYGTLGMMAISTLAQIVVIIGGINFIKGSGRGLAMFASIISVIPCMSACCVLGIPFGVWGIIVLQNPKVKSQMK